MQRGPALGDSTATSLALSPSYLEERYVSQSSEGGSSFHNQVEIRLFVSNRWGDMNAVGLGELLQNNAAVARVNLVFV